MAKRDPRSIITPDSFSVAPQLLGLPLAKPYQRAFAMLIDLILVVILVQSGAVFLGIAAAFILLRAAKPDPSSGFIKRSIRQLLRFSAAGVLFIVIVLSWGFWRDDGDDSDEVPARQTMRASNLQLNFSTREQPEAASGREPNADSLARAYLQAVGQNDTTQARLTRDSLKRALAGMELSTLRRQMDSLDERRQSLQAELQQARETRGLRSYIGALFEDLGVGFGWSAVYFTGFLALWRGKTPGKRLVGIRVIRLDGKPIGWWISFERFGGYAASLTLGLLGFLQILWDRNRQGLHDKACETVVIIDQSLKAPAR